MKALAIYLGLGLALGLVLLPVGSALWASLRREVAPARTVWTLDHYVRVLQHPNLVRALVNSTIVATAVTVLVLSCAVLAAFGLHRYRPPGLPALLVWIISLRAFPLLLALIPLFRLFWRTGLNNTLWGIVLAQGAFILPFAFWLTLAYVRQIPLVYYEAAELEGGSLVTSLGEITLPLIRPGLAVIAFYAFVLSWNDYVIVSIVNLSSSLNTLPFALVSLRNSLQSDPRLVLALTSLLLVPPTVIYALIQRQLGRETLDTLP